MSTTTLHATTSMTSALSAGIPATIGYFLAGALILVVGFYILDLLTPGRLRDLVFLENRAGAAVIAGAQQIALACIVVSVILASDDNLLTGLGETLIYGALGILLQTIALLALEVAIPGRFRDVVMDAKVRPRAALAAVTFIVIGVINAVALS